MDDPAAGCAFVAEPVVQPVGLAVPEVDPVRPEAIATPVRRPGDFLALELVVELGDAALEPASVRDVLCLG